VLKCVSSSRTAPAKEPVLPEEVKEGGRINYTDHDPALEHLITEARMWAEDNELQQALITQTVTEKFRKFEGDLELRWSPVQTSHASTAVAYIDTNGDSQTLATTVYEIAEHLGIWVCRRKYNQVWPNTRDQEDAVTITYVVGYGDDRHDVPLPIRQALKVYAVYQYDGSIDDELLTAARRLLGPYSAKR
jgi:uncharacterized phiE125 gp8 family phage protein